MRIYHSEMGSADTLQFLQERVAQLGDGRALALQGRRRKCILKCDPAGLKLASWSTLAVAIVHAADNQELRGRDSARVGDVLTGLARLLAHNANGCDVGWLTGSGLTMWQDNSGGI